MAADHVEGSLRGLASTAVWPGRSPHLLRGCCLQIKELLQDLERLLQVCHFRQLGVSHSRCAGSCSCFMLKNSSAACLPDTWQKLCWRPE